MTRAVEGAGKRHRGNSGEGRVSGTPINAMYSVQLLSYLPYSCSLLQVGEEVLGGDQHDLSFSHGQSEWWQSSEQQCLGIRKEEQGDESVVDMSFGGSYKISRRCLGGNRFILPGTMDFFFYSFKCVTQLVVRDAGGK